MDCDLAGYFIEKMKETIARFEMIEPGDKLVVGVSGGADSVALIHALAQLQAEYNLQLVIGHLHHGIRGKEADEDAEFVARLAESLGLPLDAMKEDVPRAKRTMKVGLEEAARRVRYEFLERLADESKAQRIAVAHTSDDQAETVLLNVLRGSGIEGLVGISPVRGRVVRPLIQHSRREIEQYLSGVGQEWRIDASNVDTSYTRNRIRHDLIPHLQQNFNPAVKNALLTLSEIARDESGFLQSETANVFQSITRDLSSDCVAFDAEAFGALHIALKRRTLRRAIELVKGDLLDVEFEQVERVIRHLACDQDFSFTLPSGRVYAALSGGELKVFKLLSPEVINLCRSIAVPGVTSVPELDIQLAVRQVDAAMRPSSDSEAVLDADCLVGRLTLRTWRTGDRIQPFGMTGRKKIQDLFVDNKIARADRGRIPIVVDDEKIVWVVGVSMSELVRVTAKTERALHFEALSDSSMPGHTG